MALDVDGVSVMLLISKLNETYATCKVFAQAQVHAMKPLIHRVIKLAYAPVKVEVSALPELPLFMLGN